MKKKQKFGLLNELDHTNIKYETFRKDFYIEDEQIRDLPESQVNMLR